MTNESQKRIVRLNTYADFPYLIEITTPDGTVTRYANSDTDITFESNVYKAGYFKLNPPEKKQNSISDASITISAIDQTWIKKIRETEERSKIRFIAIIRYMSNGSTVLEPMEDLEFELTNATWNNTSITWTMIFDDDMDLQIPADVMNVYICPSLV